MSSKRGIYRPQRAKKDRSTGSRHASLGPLVRKMENMTRSTMISDGLKSSIQKHVESKQLEDENKITQEFETNLQTERERVKKNLFASGRKNPKGGKDMDLAKQKFHGRNMSNRGQIKLTPTKLPQTPAVEVKHSQLLTWVTSQQVMVERRSELPGQSSGRVNKWEKFQKRGKERKEVRMRHRRQSNSQPLKHFQLNLSSAQHSPKQAGGLAWQQEEVDDLWRDNKFVEQSGGNRFEMKDNIFMDDSDTEMVRWKQEMESAKTLPESQDEWKGVEGGPRECGWELAGGGNQQGVFNLPYQGRNEVLFQHLPYDDQGVGGREQMELAGSDWGLEVLQTLPFLPDLDEGGEWGEDERDYQQVPVWRGPQYREEETWKPRLMW